MKTTYREAMRAALRDARPGRAGVPHGRGRRPLRLLRRQPRPARRFGPERVRDAPLSESAFVGAGIGAALGGLRPIVEIMTVNFSLLALDQIVNSAATLRHMSGGQFNVPLVVRMTTQRRPPATRPSTRTASRPGAHIPASACSPRDPRRRPRHAHGRPCATPTRSSSSSTAPSTTSRATSPTTPAVDIDRAAVRRPGSAT